MFFKLNLLETLLFWFKLELFKNLSGGNKQKISIARSIYKNPQVFFFDEPTTFLDTNTINNLTKFINDRKDKTFVIVSHDVKIINLCNKIINL
jgi:ABC-type lipoprotein export system ATPase subunit